MLKYAISVILFMVVLGGTAFFFLTDQVGVKLKKAIDMRDREQHEEAANLFGEIALMHPQSPHADKALFEQGFTYLIKIAPKVEQNQKPVYLKLAGNAFRSIISDYAQSRFLKDSLVYMAKISSELGELDQAINYYSQACEEIEDPAEKQKIFFNMVRNFELMNRHDLALEKLQEIIAIGQPGVYLENAYLTLAGYYRIVARERPHEKLDAYGSLLQLLSDMIQKDEISTPSRRDALMLMAEAFFELDRYERCEEVLQMIESLESEDKTFTLKETDVMAIEGYRKRIDQHRRMGK